MFVFVESYLVQRYSTGRILINEELIVKICLPDTIGKFINYSEPLLSDRTYREGILFCSGINGR
jgi:hypothetical protein